MFMRKMDNEKYTITDLYIAAFLKAIGYTCDIETKNKRSFFIFDPKAKQEVSDFVTNSNREHLNVNAITLINEIKQLKAFVNNIR